MIVDPVGKANENLMVGEIKPTGLELESKARISGGFQISSNLGSHSPMDRDPE